MILSCPNYVHADVSDGEDLSRHQQEVTGGQFVTMSLVPGAVDSDVCVALFYENDIGESLCTVTGLHRERAKGDTHTIRDRRRPNLTLSPLR